MDKIVCILLILLLLCIMYYTFDCGCSKGVANGFSVGCEKGPVMCNPTADPPQNCPGEIPCPQCGNPACECPTGPCLSKMNELCGPVKGVENECDICIGENQGKFRDAYCDEGQIKEFCKGEINPPPPPPGPIPSGNLNCINSNFKGICIDDFSATINPESWFGKDTSNFKWPLTNYPIEVIRTYNWNKMKNWVLWALKNNIKVLIGTDSFDSDPTSDEISILQQHIDKIIAISPVNEGSKQGPTFNFLPDSIPRIKVFIHKDPNSYGTQPNNILAVNIYGIYLPNMCVTDGCDQSMDNITLNQQIIWKGENPTPILENEFNDIFEYNNNVKFWLTETGWSSYPVGCDDSTCSRDSKFRRLIAWSNTTNLKRFYEEFLKYDNTDSTKTPEYIFYFCLSDTYNYLGGKKEGFGLYNSATPFPQPKF